MTPEVSQTESRCARARARARFRARGLALALTLALFSPSAHAEIREILILHTNDFESAIDPIPAFWMQGSPLLGGAAHLKTMVDRIREREERAGVTVFLFDSGDMFTGMLSRVTKGEVLIEMMITMGYDAMGMGNHEFDYGSANFLQQSYRAPFPILSANTFYKGTEVGFMRPHVILEREGFRIGVIGIIGQDAMSVVVPTLVSDLEFRDPAPYARRSIQELEDSVDLIVVLGHQGKTGPMQSDQEAHPELARDFQIDIDLTTQVEGIDVFLGGHAHIGIEPPYINPYTGTIISQTYGHGTRLGSLRLRVDTETGTVVSHEGKLLKPFSAGYPPDEAMQRKMRAFKERHRKETGLVLGHIQERLIRKYNAESSMGNFVCDVIQSFSGAEVAMTNAGGLRADLPKGEVTNGNVYDALPFLNSVVVVEMTASQIREVLEQSLSLERGMMQVAGIVARYDLSRPIGRRLVELELAGEPVSEDRKYRVATNTFVAEGGDLYKTFEGLKWVENTGKSLAQVVMESIRTEDGSVPVPSTGRLIPIGQ